MVGLLMKEELERTWDEVVGGIRIEWMRKTAKTSDNRCLGRDVKSVASQYRWIFFVSEPTCSVKHFRPDV